MVGRLSECVCIATTGGIKTGNEIYSIKSMYFAHKKQGAMRIGSINTLQYAA